MSTKNSAGKIVLQAVIGLFTLIILKNLFEYFLFPKYYFGSWRSYYFWGFYLIGVYYLVKVIIKINKKKLPPAQLSIDHGSARWATLEEFNAAGNAPADKGLWLGDHHRRSKQGHLITIAGSGQGKNACIILPNLLVNPSGSYVVTDPKGENACITARNQKEYLQNVFILDPWDEQKKIGAKHNIAASGFNPFDFIKKDLHELRDNCELVASYLVPENPNAKDPYWDDRARTLLRTCLMHIITDRPKEEHNFWTLYKMVRVSGDAWLSLLADMKLNDSLEGLISIAAEEFIGMDPTGSALTGIRSNAQNATTIFESSQIRQSLEKSEFDPYELSKGNCTVYIVLPERYLETHSAWLRLVVGLCLKAVNSRPDKRVNFFLDEFAVMGKMKDVQKAYAFGRGQNIVMWIFAQSLSQLKEIYGEDGMNTFISNAAIFQVFGVKDHYTVDYVSKALGDSTLIKTTQSMNNNGKDISTGVSMQSFGRPLLTPEEVAKCDYIIVFADQLKFQMAKIGYYQNRFDGMNWRDPRLHPVNKKIIKSGKIPKDLREIFSDRADTPPRILN